MKKVNWLELTPEEFVDRRAECPVCYMPYGLAECHGVYNYLGTDWYPVLKICELAVAKGGGIVAPYLLGILTKNRSLTGQYADAEWVSILERPFLRI